MREGEIIANYFAPLAAGEAGSFALSNDAAMLEAPVGHALVVTTDSVIQGVHVLPDATPQQYAVKLMRRNLSDLAAMGATPWRYLLNLHAPRILDGAWYCAFADALATEQARFNITLCGGDTTLGGDSIHLTLTALGLSDGPMLTRSGARVGDTLYASGTIGDAALGLAMLQADHAAHGPWVERYHTPQPRLALGRALRSIATACLDCSDGLLKDTTRLCTASNVGVEIMLESVPVSEDTRALLSTADSYEARSTLWQTIVTGGDDYELIFTAPPERAQDLQEIARFLQVPLTAIGTITDDGLRYRDAAGTHLFHNALGFEY